MSELGVFHEFYFTLRDYVIQVDTNDYTEITLIDVLYGHFVNEYNYDPGLNALVEPQTYLDIKLVGKKEHDVFQNYLERRIKEIQRRLLAIYHESKGQAKYFDYQILLYHVQVLKNLPNKSNFEQTQDILIVRIEKVIIDDMKLLSKQLRWAGMKFKENATVLKPVHGTTLKNLVYEHLEYRFLYSRADADRLVDFLKGQVPHGHIYWKGTAAELCAFLMLLDFEHHLNLQLNTIVCHFFQPARPLRHFQLDSVMHQLDVIQKQEGLPLIYQKDIIIKWRNRSRQLANLQEDSFQKLSYFFSPFYK